MLHSNFRIHCVEHFGSIGMELLNRNEKKENSARVVNPTSISFVLGKSWLKLPVFMSL